MSIVPETQEDNSERYAAQILSTFATMAADKNTGVRKPAAEDKKSHDLPTVDATQLLSSCGVQSSTEKRRSEIDPEADTSTEKKARTEVDLTNDKCAVVRPPPVPVKLASFPHDAESSTAFKPIAEAAARCESMKKRPIVAVPAKEFVFSQTTIVPGQPNVVTIATGPVQGVDEISSIVPFDRALSFDVMAPTDALTAMSALADVVNADASKFRSMFVCRRSDIDVSVFDNMSEKSRKYLTQAITSHHKFDAYLSMLHNYRLQFSVQTELQKAAQDCSWNDTTHDFDTLWKTFDPSTFVLSIRMTMLPPNIRAQLFPDAVCNIWPMAVGFLKSHHCKTLLLTQLLCCAVLHPSSSPYAVAEFLLYIAELNSNPEYAPLLQDGSFYHSTRSSQNSLTHKYCKLALLLSAIRFRPINAYWAVNRDMFGRYSRKVKLAAADFASSVFYAEPIKTIVSLAAVWIQLSPDEFMAKCVQQRKLTDCITLDLTSQRTWIQPVGAWMNDIIASIDNVDSMREVLWSDWSITWWRFFGFNSNYQSVYTALHLLVPIPYALFFQKVTEVASFENAIMLLNECRMMFRAQGSMFDDRQWRVMSINVHDANSRLQYQRTGLKDVDVRSRLRRTFYDLLKSFPGGLYIKSISPGAVVYPFGAVLACNMLPSVKAGEHVTEDAVSASCDDEHEKDDSDCKLSISKDAVETKVASTGETTLCTICQSNQKTRCIFYNKKYYISLKLDALLEHKQITAEEASTIATKLATIPHELFEWAIAYACISSLVANKATVGRVMTMLNTTW